MKKRMAVSIGLATCLSFNMHSAEASGFANADASAAGIGVANAMVAGVADVSAASYNPAAIAWLDGINVQLNSAIELRNSSVIVPAGVTSNGGNNYKVQGFHAAWMPHRGNLGVSAALTRPFVNQTSWFGEQTTIDVNRWSLDLVYALSSTLSVASGVDVYQSRMKMTQGAAFFSGRDKASFGINVGVNWKPAPFWQAGMLLRTGTRAKVAGAAGKSVDLNLPEQLTLGVSHDMNDAVRLEADLEYTHWSRLKNLNVNGGTIVHSGGLKNTLSLKTGLTWYWLPNSTFRFGYAYDPAANSLSAYEPALADQAGHRLSMGAGGDLFGVHVDVAYAYSFYFNQTVTAPVAVAGIYRDRQQTWTFSLSKVF